ncbi:MAG: hypothetical protein KKC85_06170, partial [Gammaproteobacteria bacterium]|nr:hypothetical protein [Gammaproteobacteria bacterium]
SRSCIGADEDVDTNSCSPADGLMVGNPILPPTAEKYQPETDYAEASPGGLSFSRNYRSNRGLDTTRAAGPLGKTWTHNHSLSLAVVTSSTSGTSTATLTTPEGYTRTFTQANATAPWVAVQNADTLIFTPGANAPWTYRRADDDSTARFDSSGRLLSLTRPMRVGT